MTEFNFDIDQIANNTVAKVDKTTQIIETNTGLPTAARAP